MDKVIKLFEFSTLVLLVYIILSAFTEHEFAKVVFYFKYFAFTLSIFYVLLLFKIKQTNDLPIGIVKLTFFSFAMVTTGITLKLIHIPGGSLLLVFGMFFPFITTMIIIINTIKNKSNETKQEIVKENNTSLIYSNKNLLLRLVIFLFLSIFVYRNTAKLTPYEPKQELINYLTSDLKISQYDAKMISAWFDVSRGFKKEKVLKTYEISEEDFNTKAEALAFGGKDNIPKFKYVEVVNFYSEYSKFAYQNIDDILFAEDTAYIHSLRPIFYDFLKQKDLHGFYDLENLAKHTNNSSFKEFVKNECSSETEDLDYLCNLW
ncbi:MAG: hypothetical protein MJ211_09970 [Bacteroidales bacterium]|nr:hypothetical protein [Bacteroidales bacterium]